MAILLKTKLMLNYRI